MQRKFILLTTLVGCLSYAQQGLSNPSFDGNGYTVKMCDAGYMGRPAQCEFSGKGQALRVKGIVISQDQILVGGEIRINKDGRVAEVGCQVAKEGATTMDCKGALISPGFINLHEHIDYSYQKPANPPTKRWNHRDEWRMLSDEERGFHGDAPKDPAIRTEVSELAMLRHLLSGTTAIAGAKHYLGFSRNLALTNTLLGTPGSFPVDSETFPISKPIPATIPCTIDKDVGIKFNPSNPYTAHVGEGVNQTAYCEIDQMIKAMQIKTTPKAFIHDVAVDDRQIKQLAEQNISIVLSPRSNIELYGITAPIPELKRSGVNLALSTDWSPSGSLTMLGEMRCLAHYNHQNLNDFLSWADIHRMSTQNAAKAVGLEGQIGNLAPNELADFTLIDTRGAFSLGDVLNQASYPEILAVFIAGKGATFPTAWTGKLSSTLSNCEVDPRNLCGQSRMICGANPDLPLKQLLRSTTYTIDETKLCHPEPVSDCTPYRPSEFDGIPTHLDHDGDGIPDNLDNCPALFNPPLPKDGGKQADMSKMGEACQIQQVTA